jgi:putative transposase
MLGAISLGAFAYSLYGLHQEVEQARTVAFTVMVVAQLVHAFNCRSERLSLFHWTTAPLTKLVPLTVKVNPPVPATKVLILSAHSDDAYVEDATNSGARGFLLKQTSSHDLSRAIREVVKGNTFFSPSIAKRLHEQKLPANGKALRKRVARLMRAAGVQGVSRRKSRTTTRRDPAAAPAPDLVSRDFAAAGPDRLWVADITYIPTWAGFLYLAVVLDVWSRRVIGWAMATHLRTELVLDALNMAVAQRRPTTVIHHSDQGCQYTSITFGLRCREAGIRPSMGSVGDAYDNALCESFFATLECELLDRCRFPTQVEARMAVFDFIEGWYNPHRRHSGLDYLSPISYEQRHPVVA